MPKVINIGRQVEALAVQVFFGRFRKTLFFHEFSVGPKSTTNINFRIFLAKGGVLPHGSAEEALAVELLNELNTNVDLTRLLPRSEKRPADPQKLIH